MVRHMGKDEKKQKVCTCNRCGHVMHISHGVLEEDCLYIEKAWGYFSKKDGTRHSWYLCEACYDALVAEFVIPVEAEKMTELV